MISILTGTSEATDGTADVGGFNLNTEKDLVKQIIGICPQHDVLWEVS